MNKNDSAVLYQVPEEVSRNILSLFSLLEGQVAVSSFRLSGRTDHSWEVLLDCAFTFCIHLENEDLSSLANMCQLALSQRNRIELDFPKVSDIVYID